MTNYRGVGARDVRITGGFWKRRQDINSGITADAVYQRFSDTHRFAALSCRWKDGMPGKPHHFWDSDVAKWIEGVAYILMHEKNAYLEKLCDHAIEEIIANQDESGYYNSYYLTLAPDERFTIRDRHELYCAGHLIEAACAYAEATGKDAFLRAMCRFADHIYDTFYVYRSASFAVCGHPEIELALVRLADATGEKKYLELARFFVDMRGNNGKDEPVGLEGNMFYDQSHMPLALQRTAEGHAVRALYIYCAMADIAVRYEDHAYAKACRSIFENIVDRRMYITGATGSTQIGEAFTVDYDLPNRTAYAETCASIALTLFGRRMLMLEPDAYYADAVERAMYNGALSGVSLDGRAFFYENPLEIDPAFADVNTSTTRKQHMPIMQRVEVFECSCCPPNIVRFIASMGAGFYTYTDDTVFVHQYAASSADVGGGSVVQQTNYPAEGSVHLSFGVSQKTAALRIPIWCESFTVSEPYSMMGDYVYIRIPESGEIDLCFDMPVRLIEANPAVQDNAGRVAVMRGPVVYCAEGIDNGEYLRSISLVNDRAFELEENETYGVPMLKTRGVRKQGSRELYRRYTPEYEEAEITLIPYFAFANRGVSEMAVWLHVLPALA